MAGEVVSTNNLKHGMVIILDGELFEIVEFQHIKPGKGGAFVRTKLKNLKNESLAEKTLNAGVKVSVAKIEKVKLQYLYQDQDSVCFMDTDTYEQTTVFKEDIGEAPKFITDNLILTALFHEGKLVGMELPVSVDLKVVSTDPGVRGDTAQGGSKPAKTETGAVIQVPLFINVGDVIKVDTRNSKYIERA